jgi:hypothetical protein
MDGECDGDSNAGNDVARETQTHHTNESKTEV